MNENYENKKKPREHQNLWSAIEKLRNKEVEEKKYE